MHFIRSITRPQPFKSYICENASLSKNWVCSIRSGTKERGMRQALLVRSGWLAPKSVREVLQTARSPPHKTGRHVVAEIDLHQSNRPPLLLPLRVLAALVLPFELCLFSPPPPRPHLGCSERSCLRLCSSHAPLAAVRPPGSGFVRLALPRFF